MKHKRLIVSTVLAIVGLSAIAAWAIAGNIVGAGSDLTFRGAEWDVVQATGDVTITNSGVVTINSRYYELIFHGTKTTTLASGGAWANVTSLVGSTNTAGFTVSNANGSISPDADGVFVIGGVSSLQDPDSPSEGYTMSIGVDGVAQTNCENHLDVSVQNKHMASPINCLLSVSAGEVVTLMANSAGGDDIGTTHINWYLREF